MLLSRLARVSQEVAATSARSRKIELLAELFREAEADDVPVVIPYLAGRLPQGRIGVGWKVFQEGIEFCGPLLFAAVLSGVVERHKRDGHRYEGD